MAESLKKRVVKGSLIILGGDGMINAIRLLSNLVLTRLLVPEMFGLMAIANVVLMGLALFSDIGVGLAVIRSERGNDPEYLNTAWTMTILRGIMLWLLTVVAAYPASLFYNEPLLARMIPVMGFSFVLEGFRSLAPALLKKQLKMGRLVVMKIGTKVIAICCMIVLAYFYRSVWAMVFAGLVGSLSDLVWSYFLGLKLRHHLCWNRAVATELFHYGKWIFLSTAISFLATQADRLLLGKLFSMALLGVYSIASGIALVPRQMTEKVAGDMIFPLISMHVDLPRPALRAKILQKRKLMLLALALLIAVLAVFGDLVIDILYDPRYVEAGWILPVLAMGMWPMLLCRTIDQSLFVVDNPKYPAVANMVKFIYMVTCLPLAFFMAGKLGAILVIAFNDLPGYGVINYGLRKKGLSGLGQDGWCTLVLLALASLLLVVRIFFGLGFPGYAAYQGQVLL